MLMFNYKDEEEFNNNIFSGKIQREIFDYIKEIYEDREKHPDCYTIELNNENIYYLFNAEVGDECISYEKIYSPGTNKYAKTLHDLIKAVYEEFILQRTLWEKNNYKEVTINTNLDSQELYEMITSVIPFAKVAKGRYLDYIKKSDFNFKDAEIIYSACNIAWFKSDASLSLDYIVSFTCQSLNDNKVRVNEIQHMSSTNLIDAVINQNFEYYTTLHYKEEMKSSLEDVLNNPNYDVIYNLNNKDTKQFLQLYSKDKNCVPEVMIVNKNLAIDNSEGDCFTEEFDCHEKALKWVEGESSSIEEVLELFSTYEEKLDVEEHELEIRKVTRQLCLVGRERWLYAILCTKEF